MSTKTELSIENIVDQEIELSEVMIDSLVALLGYRCRHETKARLRSILTYNGNSTLSSLPSWVKERLVFNGTNFVYVAGQSYPEEITSIRKMIIS